MWGTTLVSVCVATAVTACWGFGCCGVAWNVARCGTKAGAILVATLLGALVLSTMSLTVYHFFYRLFA